MESKKVIKITLVTTILLSIIGFIVLPILWSISLFLTIFLPILLYLGVYVWIKKRFASVIFSLSIWVNIIIILIPIALGLIIWDISEFSKEFQEKPKYILLNDKDKILFGININSLDLNGKDPIRILEKEESLRIKNEIKNKPKDKIIIEIDKEIFRNINSIEIDNKTINKEEINRILESNNNELKNIILLKLVEEKLKTEGVKSLVNDLKENRISIYPKRLSVEILIRIIPANLIEDFIPVKNLM